MGKALRTLAIILVFCLLSLGKVRAADLSLQLEIPKSPTNQRDFTITFVALDIQNRPVVVRCYRKSPGEAGFSIFDTDKNLPAGGGSATCSITSSLITAEGAYDFYVRASADAETIQSNTVSVDYQAGGPGTPTYYGKDNPAVCQYSIKFRTAGDGGKTVKVEVYRSTETSFNADAGTRIASIAIGSNLEGSHLDTVPECNTTYYYAIRAFNNAGNGSDAVGDTQAVTIVEEAPKTVVQAAIPVEPKTVEQQPLVAEPDQQEEATGSGEILGETNDDIPTPPQLSPGFFSSPTAVMAILALSGILMISLGVYLFFRSH